VADFWRDLQQLTIGGRSAVCVVHHTGWDRIRPRGSVDWRGGTDIEVSIVGKEVSWGKMKNALMPHAFGVDWGGDFYMRQVPGAELDWINGELQRWNLNAKDVHLLAELIDLPYAVVCRRIRRAGKAGKLKGQDDPIESGFRRGPQDGAKWTT
jgi:hypothetical protein